MSAYAYALGGLLLWGLAPLYWKKLGHVSAFEIILHRVVWSAAFMAAWLAARGGLREAARQLRDRRHLAWLSLSTFLVGSNWWAYIWGVNSGRVLETSIGYFFLPLAMIGLGVVVLGEKLRLSQKIALALAGLAVVNLGLAYGRVPWLALYLAVSFACYAYVRKTIAVDATTGLAIETFLLTPPSLLAMAVLHSRGELAAATAGSPTLLFLAATPVATALPLLWYTEGARRLPLRTLGFLQYLSPTCQFLLAAFVFREPLSGRKLLSFALVWAGLALVTADAVRRSLDTALAEA